MDTVHAARHLYVDFAGSVFDLDRADALHVHCERELVARFGDVELTIFEGDACTGLGRVLVWLEGGPDPCAFMRRELRQKADDAEESAA